ncbi:hypothetical protein BGW39_002516 [Mortierella sp. 14UC]|nr:hypothetical protein BGW39_002516 [Mortierella sp. 14UC]
MRSSIIFASISLAAVASAATFSTASTVHAAAATNTTSTPEQIACFDCLMNTFLKAVPACERAMLDDISSKIQLNDKGKACVCPVSAMVVKPAVLAPCQGPQLCTTNFTAFTTNIFDQIGKNNNCAAYNAALATQSGAHKGTDAFSGMFVALTSLLAMAAAGAL